MDFGLDVRPSLSRPTGVGTYVLGLVERLPALAPDDRFHFFSASVKERYPRGRGPRTSGSWTDACRCTA